MDGLLREEDRPVKGGDETSGRCKREQRMNQVYLKPITTQEHAEVMM